MTVALQRRKPLELARVSLVGQGAETVDRFSARMRRLPQVVECYIMAGECDVSLRVAARDLDDYRQFRMMHLNQEDDARISRADISMQNVKASTELPV